MERNTQIDHLVINRLGFIYIIETKNWEAKIIINKYGEFSVESNGKKYGVESPLEQNRRHVKFLEWYLEKNSIWPSRFGVQYKPECINMVLLRKRARIKRPMRAIFDTSKVIRVDRFASEFDTIGKDVKLKDAWKLLNIITKKELIEIGEKLIFGHCPKKDHHSKKYNHSLLKKKNSYYCASCKISISTAVAKYCWNNKKKFGGKPYCKDCQKKITSENR